MSNEEQQQEYMPADGFVPGSRKNDNFLQWFLSLSNGINDLKLSWRGWERNESGHWVRTPQSELFRLMNEKGIHWAISLMNSYLTKVAQATNWDNEHMAFEMRVAARVVWFTLSVRYKEFDLTKTNAANVGDTIFFQIHAMLSAARGEGIRKFIQTTQSVSEHRVLNDNINHQGMFTGIKGLFGGRANG